MSFVKSSFAHLKLISLLLLACGWVKAQPAIGGAKNASNTGREITYDIYIENLGDEVLQNISAPDDLDAAFGMNNYAIIAAPSFIINPGTLTLNGSFNGSGNTELIASGTLAVGAIAQIQFIVDVTVISDQGMGPGIYSNQVTVSGEDMSMTTQSDLTDWGTDPDPNGNGDASDAGEDDPTIVDIFEVPIIGVGKKVTLSGTQITFDFFLENFGNRTMVNLNMPDDLDAVFGAGNYVIVSPPALIDDPGTITVNAAFNGSAMQQLITSGSLNVMDTAQIRVVLNVTTVSDVGLGLGVYENQVLVSGQTSLGTFTSDLSDNGAEPDSDGDGDPTDPDEDDPTRFTIGSEAAIGVAKTASVLNSQVTFNYYLENLGNDPISAMSLPDNLDNVFGASNYQIIVAPAFIDDPGTITLNPGFDGIGNSQLLVPASSSLAVGDTAQIQMVIRINNLSDQGLGLGNYRNQVTATAQGLGGAVTDDTSDDGTDPDPNGNGDPAEPGENDPTDFTVAQLPIIGLAMDVNVVGSTGATINVGGMNMPGFGPRVYINYYIENLGNVTLSNLILDNDLDAVFGAGNYGTIVSASLPTILYSDGGLNVNTNFNGSTLQNILTGASTIGAGEIAAIRVELLVTNITDQGMGIGVYQNQTSISGEGPSGGMTSDLSDEGNVADANNNGDPTDAGEDDPTIFVLGSFIGAAKDASVAGNQITFDLYLENFGTIQLNNLSLDDNLAGVFGAGNFIISVAPFFVDDPGTIALNMSFDGSGDRELIAPGSTLASLDTAQIQFEVTVLKLITQANALGAYSNQAQAAATQAGGIVVLDSSETGTDPDPNGNGDPTEFGENDPTPFTVTTDAMVGAAKTATATGTQVTIDIYLESFGTATTTGLIMPDNLDAVFGAGNYTIFSAPTLVDDPGTLVLNGAFNGSGNTELLAAGSTLNALDTAQIQFVVDVTNIVDRGFGIGIYENQVLVTGLDSTGLIVCDLSDSGTDPDINGDGDPTFPGLADPPLDGENDITRFIIGEAVIGAAYHSAVSGNFITYDYYLENLGDVTVSNISVSQSLIGVFGFGNFTISTAPFFIDDPGTLSLVTAFDGTFVTTLISNGTLAPGDTARIRLVLNVTNPAMGPNYTTQFTVNGISPVGLIVSDLSDNGIVTDPDGDGNPSEAGEDDPTISIIGIESILGVAKNASVSAMQVTFDYYLENLGNVVVASLSLTDDLDTVFGAGNYTINSAPTLIDDPGTIVADVTFNGSFQQSMILPGSILNPSDTAQIRLVIDVLTIADVGLGFGQYSNQVMAGGIGPTATVTQDLSDFGTDPDPNGNGNPSDAGEGDPTTFSLVTPEVGIAKSASIAGQQVTFDFYIENLGNVILDSFSLFEDLDAVFGAGNYTLDSGPVFVTVPRNLVLNPSFDGVSDMQMIASGTMDPGITEQIRIVVTVNTLIDSGMGNGVYSNQVTVNAAGPGPSPVSDISDMGINPDPNGNGDPTDAGEDDPTIFGIPENPVIGVAKTAAVNGRTVTMDIYLEAFGNVPLNTLSVVEDLNAVFGAGNYAITSAPALIVNPGTITLNGGFNGGATTDLLTPSTLAIGATAQIRYVIDVTTVSDQGFGIGSYFNQVTASAFSPDGAPTSDISDNGTDSDPNGNGDPDEAGENDPTPIILESDIGDFVWNDLNGDGIQDGGEPGLAGVIIYLDLNTNGTLDGGEPSDTTDGAGAYLFTNLAAASYTVRVELSTVPAGFVLTSANNPTVVMLSAGEVYADADFGFQQQDAMIGDFVWNDLNGNGIQDGGEPGLAGVTVYLDLNSNSVFDGGEPNDTSDGVGAYAITNLAIGIYTVRVDPTTVPAGFVLTSANIPLSVPLAAGDNFMTADFGYQQQDATIGDFVWNDLNGDGVQDGGEPGQPSVTVFIDLNTNGVLDGGEPTAMTDGAGAYDFIALAAGTYSIRIDLTTIPANFGLTTLNPVSVSLAAGEDFNDADFGVQQQDATIGDFVWDDLNGDGVQDGGEPGLPGVTIYADINSNSTLDVGEPFGVTDGAGAYDITNLGAGTYTARVDNPPAGYMLTTANDPFSVVLTAGEDFNDADFGYLLLNGTIGDFVWSDINGDGVQDGGEPGLAGVTVYLDLNMNSMFDGGEPFATTDGVGAYDIIDVPPAAYSVNIDPTTTPVGYALTTANLPLSVTLTPGEDYNDADFGFQQLGTIGDFVWNDQNGDGVQDAGEPGLPGVTVYLDLNMNATFDGGEPSAITDGAGLYDIIDVVPGSYDLQVDAAGVPAGFALTTTNLPLPVTLLAGGDFNDGDFGYQDSRGSIGVAKAATSTTTSVSYVFRVENTGTVALMDLSILEDLDAVFGVGIYQVAAPPMVINALGSTANGNPGFNGNSDQELFAANSGLAVGGFVELLVTVDMIASTPPGTIFTNQVTATATTTTGVQVSDLSHNGTDPDENGNGDPGDDQTPTTIFLQFAVPTLGPWMLGLMVIALMVVAIRRNRSFSV